MGRWPRTILLICTARNTCQHCLQTILENDGLCCRLLSRPFSGRTAASSASIKAVLQDFPGGSACRTVECQNARYLYTFKNIENARYLYTLKIPGIFSSFSSQFAALGQPRTHSPNICAARKRISFVPLLRSTRTVQSMISKTTKNVKNFVGCVDRRKMPRMASRSVFFSFGEAKSCFHFLAIISFNLAPMASHVFFASPRSISVLSL